MYDDINVFMPAMSPRKGVGDRVQAHRRHDISDKVWSKIESHLSGKQGSWGGIAKDNRALIKAV